MPYSMGVGAIRQSDIELTWHIDILPFGKYTCLLVHIYPSHMNLFKQIAAIGRQVLSFAAVLILAGCATVPADTYAHFTAAEVDAFLAQKAAQAGALKPVALAGTYTTMEERTLTDGRTYLCNGSYRFTKVTDWVITPAAKGAFSVKQVEVTSCVAPSNYEVVNREGRVIGEEVFIKSPLDGGAVALRQYRKNGARLVYEGAHWKRNGLPLFSPVSADNKTSSGAEEFQYYPVSPIKWTPARQRELVQMAEDYHAAAVASKQAKAAQDAADAEERLEEQRRLAAALRQFSDTFAKETAQNNVNIERSNANLRRAQQLQANHYARQAEIAKREQRAKEYIAGNHSDDAPVAQAPAGTGRTQARGVAAKPEKPEKVAARARPAQAWIPSASPSAALSAREPARAPAQERAQIGDDPRSCVSEPTFGRDPNCKEGISAAITNGCDQTVEAKMCFFTTKGKWTCGATFGINPGKRWSHASCFGTSRIFYDVRRKGDNRKFASPD